MCNNIPRSILEHAYGISLPPPAQHEDPHRPPLATELLKSLAIARGFMSHHGLPDESRVARLVLKDYVNGGTLLLGCVLAYVAYFRYDEPWWCCGVFQ